MSTPSTTDDVPTLEQSAENLYDFLCEYENEILALPESICASIPVENTNNSIAECCKVIMKTSSGLDNNISNVNDKLAAKKEEQKNSKEKLRELENKAGLAKESWESTNKKFLEKVKRNNELELEIDEINLELVKTKNQIADEKKACCCYPCYRSGY